MKYRRAEDAVSLFVRSFSFCSGLEAVQAEPPQPGKGNQGILLFHFQDGRDGALQKEELQAGINQANAAAQQYQQSKSFRLSSRTTVDTFGPRGSWAAFVIRLDGEESLFFKYVRANLEPAYIFPFKILGNQTSSCVGGHSDSHKIILRAHVWVPEVNPSFSQAENCSTVRVLQVLPRSPYISSFLSCNKNNNPA